MPVIAVVNRKGGSGKSTLATNIAAWCAHNGWQVMLGDVDRQRSVHSWLSRRPADAPVVTSWAVDRSRVLRPPAGTTHVVLDTPGALYDHDLAKLVINVDALVVPIGPSVFDRDASLQFLAELRQLPRVSSGRCRLVAVGMRWPAEKRQAWLAGGRQWDTPLLTVIPELPVYRNSLETGNSLFDLPEDRIDTEMDPWRPLLSWLRVVWSEGFTPRKPVGRLDETEDARQLALEGFGATAVPGSLLRPAAAETPGHRAPPPVLTTVVPPPTAAARLDAHDAETGALAPQDSMPAALPGAGIGERIERSSDHLPEEVPDGVVDDVAEAPPAALMEAANEAEPPTTAAEPDPKAADPAPRPQPRTLGQALTAASLAHPLSQATPAPATEPMPSAPTPPPPSRGWWQRLFG